MSAAVASAVASAVATTGGTAIGASIGASIDWALAFGREVAGGAVILLGQGAALVALAWAAQACGLLRKRPAVWAAIWTIVSIKLILPWGPAVAGSLSDLWALLWRSASGSAQPLTLALAPSATAAARGPSLAATSLGALGLLLVAGWATISVRRVARAALHLRRQRRELAALPPAPRWLTALCEELAARFGVAAPRVVVHPSRVVPHLLYGFSRSMLVVPAALISEPGERPEASRVPDRELLQLTLAHELAHLRRRDPLARWLGTVASAVWFFLPVRALVGRPLERAQEMAADALALRVLAMAPASYARLLVDVTVRCQEGAPRAALALARPRAPGALIERVEALCVHQSKAHAGWLGAAFLAVFALAGLGQARATSSEHRGPVCEFSPELAEALREVHPEADRDGDGELGREEACALQEQLRKSALEGLESGGEQASRLGASSASGALAERSLWRQLCCQCETSSAPGVRGEPLAERAAPEACVQE